MPTLPADLPPDPVALAHARFHALVLPHLDRLLGFARRRTGDEAAAEDAVQEACVRAWTGFAELRDPASARAWLYRILRTVLADARERDDRRARLVSITRLEDAHEALLAGRDADADPVFAEVAARLDSAVVRAALAAVPDDFSAAVELHDIDGLKYQEVADVLGVPIGTVMSRISRGRRLLAGAVALHRRAWLDAVAPDAPAPGAEAAARLVAGARRPAADRAPARRP
jgi:RNA polymerase sigma-70 factor (ECF subfamily)